MAKKPTQLGGNRFKTYFHSIGGKPIQYPKGKKDGMMSKLVNTANHNHGSLK